MRKRLIGSLFAVASLATAEAPNVLLICVDDLRPELGAYGVDYIESPNIDRLAEESLLFERHYVQAPTCGASRLALLTGNYGSYSNHAFRHRAQEIAEDPDSVPPSMPLSWGRQLMPSGPWQTPQGAMHGLADGEIRGKWVNNRMKTDDADMDVYQSFPGPDSAYPDGLITDAALEELDTLANSDKPFFLAVGLIKPHLPFGAPANYMEPYAELELPAISHPEKPEGRTTWHGSGEFMQYNRWGRDPNQEAEFALELRRHYAACVSYADAQIGRVLNKLEALGLDDNTIVVLWGDHGYHLGEHAIWGKHSLFEESLHSPLIIRSREHHEEGVRIQTIAETIDIFPTLCELTGITPREGIDGVSLLPTINTNDPTSLNAISYTGSAVTLRSDSYRLIAHNDGFIELYDHKSPEHETKNIANKEPTIVASLLEIIKLRALETFSQLGN